MTACVHVVPVNKKLFTKVFCYRYAASAASDDDNLTVDQRSRVAVVTAFCFSNPPD